MWNSSKSLRNVGERRQQLHVRLPQEKRGCFDVLLHETLVHEIAPVLGEDLEDLLLVHDPGLDVLLHKTVQNPVQEEDLEDLRDDAHLPAS